MGAHAASMLLGVWLMAASQLLGYSGPARMNDHIVGPLIATFGCIAIWEVTRELRWLNLILGLWLLLAPWALGYAWGPLLNSTVVGALLSVLALVPGGSRAHYGGGWSALWRPAAGPAGRS